MKTVIEMARESGMELYGLGKNRDKFLAYLNELVSLVRADEREACAEVAEMTPCQFDDYKRIAAAIRARGNA